MRNLKDFDKFNESLLGSIFLGFVAGWLIMKFLKGLTADIYKQKIEKSVIILLINKIEQLKKLKPETVAISEFDDRYFIRFNDMKGISQPDLRIFKHTKELEVDTHRNQNTRLALTDEQYEQFIKIVKQAK